MEKSNKKPVSKKETTKKPTEQKQNTNIPEIIMKQIFNQYILDKVSFRIYLKNELIFDTANKLRKDYPIFSENDFIIGQNKYIYKWIRIETY